MRLTSREILLLTILGVVAVVVGGYIYVYEPIMVNYSLAKTEYDQKQSELDAIYSNLMTTDDMELLIVNFKNKVNVLEKSLPPVIHQEEVVLYLDKVLKDNEIKVSSTNFADDEAISTVDDEAPIDDILSQYEKFILNNKTNLEGLKEKTYNEEVVKEFKEFKVTLSLSGKYSDMKNLMEDIENYEKKIVVKDLNISKNFSYTEGYAAVNDNVIASMTLIFPYFYDNEVLKAINWPYDGKYGNEEPFTYASRVIFSSVTGTDNPDSGIITDIVSGSVTGNTNTDRTTADQSTQVAKPYKDPDFYIILRPTLSDASTISMGKYPIAYSVLYNENPGVETAFLNIVREGEQYKFQYGTMLQTYPGEGEYEVFIPYRIENGEIILEVRCQPRLPSDDLSTAILSVNNTTGLPLNIHVYDEDSNFPRFRLENKEGDNSVIYH